ncbi:hypothetical protein [Bhargavaea beijingensis]|uniref:2TM domain-containing protein n=1 Tax=Bhargavaea beijingensis TaxID=426756 RepID=A0A1G6XP11_9BACL|nr:hypothetical protein [Bhargavaea beijingensis]MCW1928031.1 hypothetical protein [Bhargavaea beijingensis]RSK34259.1 hypothetical protein EJA12_04825 [Bhargavaea beijingensis]SDD79711.1 hypothetical protein SAMN04488126_101119 [Bhargavaea beijingensis]
MNLIAYLIIAVEIGFWVFIAAGLVTRYLFGRKRLGLLLLAITPVLDLTLLIATTVDILANDATATAAHGIAAIYLGVSLTFGKRMIRWADERFRYHLMKKGPKPVKRYGFDHARHELSGSLLHVLAWMLGGGYLFLLVRLAGNPGQTEVLLQILKVWTLVAAIDVALSLSYFIWPRKAKADSFR